VPGINITVMFTLQSRFAGGIHREDRDNPGSLVFRYASL
jgi:hypothetical protein